MNTRRSPDCHAARGAPGKGSRALARPKLPEQLALVAELPRNATGKVLKQELREKLRA